MNPDAYHSTFFLILRRLRTPLITLILIYAVSVLGMSLMPGVDENGQPVRMSFFHAFYFISYTATTIGFGEIPYAFSEAQRLWALVCIYLSVIGWAYTIGSLFTLLQDQNFLRAIRTQRFASAVRRLHEPFYVVCGYGETGRLVCQALDRLGYRAVVIEGDETRAARLELDHYRTDVLALTADASQPGVLRLAGLQHGLCRGVLALTNDDAANLSIAISVRLLAPHLTALCRAESHETAANMASFGTRHIINPFERFSEYLGLALHAPDAYHLLSWLTGLPGATVSHHRDPPRGKWILCGYGRFGRFMVNALDREAQTVTVIDKLSSATFNDAHTWVQGDGTGSEALLAAGIESATGIVAVTSHDVDNLSIAVTARALNPNLFVVLRQNEYANRVLFDAFDSDVTVVPSEIVAHECQAILTTPLLEPFLNYVKQADPQWASQTLQSFIEQFDWTVPDIWSVKIHPQETPALCALLAKGHAVVRLRDVFRNPYSREESLEIKALYVKHAQGEEHVLPSMDVPLALGDEWLCVARPGVRSRLALTLSHEHTLSYVLTGQDLPGGKLWEWLARWREHG